MEFLLSLWHLAKQKRKTALCTFFGTLVPGACKWFAEQWAGNHIVDWIDCKVREMNYGVISSVASSAWNWMAVHPLQVAAYTTCGLVTFFAIETRFRDTVQGERPQNGGQLAAEEAVARTTKAIHDAMPPKLGTLPGSTKTHGLAEGLRDQFLTYGENSFYKIGATQRPDGILVNVTQNLDRNKALLCKVLLVDLKRVDNGQPCATAELHKPDGAFKYGRVFLNLASANKDLFFGVPESWRLISNDGPQIPYSWGEHRERGSIELNLGEWIASVEIEVSDSVFRRDIAFTWNGIGEPKLRLT